MRRSPRLVALVLACCAALAPFASARAEAIDATLTTLLAGRADPRDGKVYSIVPAYQSLSLVASELKVPLLDDVKIVLAGWGRVTIGQSGITEPGLRDATGGDLNLGYFEGTMFKRRVVLRLGRQMIAGGAARVTQMDGLVATLNMAGGVGLTAYGGAPVTPRFGISRGDALVGGRLFWRANYDTEIAASFIHVNDDGRAARDDLGLDARVAATRNLWLSGFGVYSLRAMRIAEGDLAINWQPRTWIQGALDYRRTAPDLFIPLTSIFSVFSQETRDELGGNIYLRPIDMIRVYGDYHAIRNESGWGHRGGLKVTLYPDRSRDTTLGAEARVLHLPTSGYVEGRLFAIRRIGQSFTVTLDADLYWLEQKINNANLSFTAAATAGWDFADGWRVVLVGIADTTPLVEKRFEGMLKIVYNHTTRVRQVQP